MAKKLLAREGIRVLGYVTQVGDVKAEIADPDRDHAGTGRSEPGALPRARGGGQQMIDLIDEVRKDRDSIGGMCELVAVGVPPGLGEPVFDKLKADLGKALLSLPAVLGFEYGAGFAVATAARQREQRRLHLGPIPQRGAGRPQYHGDQPPRRHARRHLQRAADRLPGGGQADQLHPASQRTVTRAGEPTEILVKGRHDPCLLPRFVPMGEAMVALVLVDHSCGARSRTFGLSSAR